MCIVIYASESFDQQAVNDTLRTEAYIEALRDSVSQQLASMGINGPGQKLVAVGLTQPCKRVSCTCINYIFCQITQVRNGQ